MCFLCSLKLPFILLAILKNVSAKNMNVIWEEYGAVDYSTKRQFVCGPDVCYIQARVGAKFISGELYGKFAECYAYE